MENVVPVVVVVVVTGIQLQLDAAIISNVQFQDTVIKYNSLSLLFPYQVESRYKK